MMLKKWSDVLTIVSGKNQKAVVSPNGPYPIYGSGGIMGRADDFLCEAGTTIVGRKGTINCPIFVNEPFWNVDRGWLSEYRQETNYIQSIYIIFVVPLTSKNWINQLQFQVLRKEIFFKSRCLFHI